MLVILHFLKVGTMKRMAASITTSLVTLLFIYLPEKFVHSRKANKIVAGFTCEPSVVPYYAVIVDDTEDRNYCGGSILNSKWVLTAAHCITQPPTAYTVYTGLAVFNRQDSQQSQVDLVIRHPNFSFSSWRSDIGLIRLKTPLMENRHTMYVDIPTMSAYNTLMKENRCMSSLTMGFGLREVQSERRSVEANLNDGRLQCVFLTIMHECENPSIDENTVLCARGRFGAKSDACQGDSGGPLLCQGMQVGIVASGRGCGLGYAGYYTKVAAFHDFIRRYVPLSAIHEENSIPPMLTNRSCGYLMDFNYLLFLICALNYYIGTHIKLIST